MRFTLGMWEGNKPDDLKLIVIDVHEWKIKEAW